MKKLLRSCYDFRTIVKANHSTEFSCKCPWTMNVHDFNPITIRMRIGFMHMKLGFTPLLMPSSWMFMHMNMHELGMNRAWTMHEVTVIGGIKSMKYEQNSQISWVLLGKIYYALSMNMAWTCPRTMNYFGICILTFLTVHSVWSCYIAETCMIGLYKKVGLRFVQIRPY